MCGVNGFNFKDINLIKKMSSITSNRGPDNEGYCVLDEFTIAHNRLSIIDPEKDLTSYKFKNYILSFNGEIYNIRTKKITIIRIQI